MESGIEPGILFFAVLLLAALVLEPLAKRFQLPSSAVLVLAGFVGSELAVRSGIDLGLRWHHFRDLVLFVIVPVLVFASALTIRIRALAKQLFLILVLALPAFLLSVFITAGLLFFGVGDAEYFPWLTALITGTLVAATDPAAVIDLLKSHGAPERIMLLLEGESLFNDATSIVLFNVLLAIAVNSQASTGWIDIGTEFLRVFFGGMLCGAIVGLIAFLLYPLFSQQGSRAVLTLGVAYLAYSVSETSFHVSGVMAVLATGLWLSFAIHKTEKSVPFVTELWSFNGLVANSLAFLLVGVTITVDMFSELWLVMLIGIIAVSLGRFAGIYAMMPLACKVPGVEPLTKADRATLFGGGLRGAVTAALAISLPVELEGWWIAQSVGYGIIVYTLFIQSLIFSATLHHS